MVFSLTLRFNRNSMERNVPYSKTLTYLFFFGIITLNFLFFVKDW